MPINWEDMHGLDARAVALSVVVVDAVTVDDLHRPTPCAGWNLADLLGHLIAQHRGFAAAAAGEPAQWTVSPLGDDPASTYRAAAKAVLDAFVAVEDPETPFSVPDFGPEPVPAAFAIMAHTVDYLVHAWDVAATLGRPFTPDPELVDALLPIVLSLPDDERRTAPGSPFAPGLPQDPTAPPLDQLLRALGRDPNLEPAQGDADDRAEGRRV